MRVLVVEDELKISRFLKKGLTEEGYAVDVARDGQEALSYAKSCPYDLIILDLMLPRIDGIDVCRCIRESNLDVSILVLTARDSIEDRVIGLSITLQDEWITVAVSNSVTGISEDELDSIFDSFHRLDEAREMNPTGVGLGLSIARWIARAHGGNITTESQKGVGLTFKINLPYRFQPD